MNVAAAEDDTHQISGISGADLLHDPRAMNFYSARADAETATDFLVRCTLRNLGKYLAFAWRQETMTRKIDLAGVPLTLTEGGDGPTHPRDDGPSIERLDQVIERTPFYCFNSRAHVVIARHDENRSRIAVGIEFLQDRCARLVGQTQIKQYTHSRAITRGHEKDLDVREAGHAIAGERENNRKCVAHHFIVIDDEQITGRKNRRSHDCFPGHVARQSPVYFAPYEGRVK